MGEANWNLKATAGPFHPFTLAAVAQELCDCKTNIDFAYRTVEFFRRRRIFPERKWNPFVYSKYFSYSY